MSEVKVPVSIGELLDKITILSIKSERLSDEQKLENVRKERDALISVCKDAGISVADEKVGRLKTINESLWVIEDDIRDKERKKEFDDKFIELARSVYRVNDERFKVKKEINEAYGSAFSEEKSYKEY